MPETGRLVCRPWRRAGRWLLCAAVLLGGCAGGDRAFSRQAPETLPAFTFEDAAGKQHTLAEYAGRPVLLSLWAPWCAACVTDLPALAALSTRFAASPLKVVAIGIDRHGMAGIRTVYDSLGLTRLEPFVDRSSGAVRALGIRAVPTTLLIDPQGRAVGRANRGRGWLTTRGMDELSNGFGLAPAVDAPAAGGG